MFSFLDPHEVLEAVDRLADDLASGEWERRHAALLEQEELDLGFRLLVAELPDRASRPLELLSTHEG